MNRHKRNKIEAQSTAPVLDRTPSGVSYDRTGRNTFRVARALERVAHEAPHVLKSRKPAPLTRDLARREFDTPAVPSAPPAQIARKQERVKRSQITLYERRLPPEDDAGRDGARCKERPEPRKSGGGGGKGRPFAPWCSRRS